MAVFFRWDERRPTACGFALSLLALCGCYRGVETTARGAGEDTDTDTDTDTADHSGLEGADSGSDGEAGGASCPDELGPSVLVRLNRREYGNTVRDVFGYDFDTDALPLDDTLGPFSANVLTSVVEFTVEAYLGAAEEVAEAVEPENLVDCDLAEPGCAEEFIHVVGRRAYRRPLSPDERSGLRAVYDDGAQDGGAAEGAKLVVAALLMSPQLLYRVEVAADTDDAIRALSSHETASRLSYFLWQSAPDDMLLDAADADALRTQEEIAAHAERMLDDPRAVETVVAFVRAWLGITALPETDKDPEHYPEFNDTTAQSMQREVDAFVRSVVGEGDARLHTLLTASYAYASEQTAPLYGVTIPAGGFGRVELDPATRAGLLTQLGVLTAAAHRDQSAPVLRGKLVRERLLCQALAPPPPGVNDVPDPVEPGVPNRARFEQHATDPSCAHCHVLIDPIGFGLEAYDAVGRYRTHDGGVPVDASGEIVDADVAGPFDGGVELAQRLAGSAQVQRCFVLQMFRFALARLETPADACEIEQIDAAFSTAGGDVRALLVAIASASAFRRRRSNVAP